jgi:predicted amidophosphoribosyltransferase
VPALGLLPTTCGSCGRTGASPCAACIPVLHLAPTLPAPPPLRTLRALLRYEGPAARLVLGVKARHERRAVPWLADGMALLLPDDVDVVTWAPTTHRRAATRGVDHARLLAEAVARRAGVRSHPTLLRTTARPQHGRNREERLTGPSFQPSHSLAGLVVAVVDDVVTTGSTIAAAAGALVVAGAEAVHGVAAAAVPDVREGPNRSLSGD